MAMKPSADPMLLIQAGLWIAENMPTWSIAHTSQEVAGRQFDLRISFIRHNDYCTSLLSVFGPLQAQASLKRKRVPITSTWNVDNDSEVIFGHGVLEDESTESHPGIVSISVMPDRDGQVLLAAMLHGSYLNVTVGADVLKFSLSGAAKAIDAALEVSEKGEDFYKRSKKTD